MNIHSPPPATPKPRISADRGALLRTLVNLWPYIWPSDRRDLKLRVLMSALLLLAAKLATIAVPFTFKWATDALVGEGSAPFAPQAWFGWALAVPILMTLAYGGTRVLMALLSLRFHLERKTGGLTRVLERGRNGIETIVRMVILQLAPTIVEVALILGVLLWQFDWRYVALILVTVVLYMGFTYYATEWRIGIRRQMNDSDSDANTKAID